MVKGGNGENRKIRDKKKWIRDVNIVMQSFREIGELAPESRRFRAYFGTTKKIDEQLEDRPEAVPD